VPGLERSRPREAGASRGRSGGIKSGVVGDHHKSSTARQLAVTVLLAWEAHPPVGRMPLNQLAEDLLARAGPWSQPDRSLVRELVWGVVRWCNLLDLHIDLQLRSKKKRLPREVRAYLRVGAYQILFLDRVPPSAAVNEAVRGVRSSRNSWAAGLTNAVLRRLAERREALGPGGARALDQAGAMGREERLSVETAHPLWMVRRWVSRYGYRGAETLCRWNNIQAPLVLRVNTLRLTREALIQTFAASGLTARAGSYSPEAVTVRDFRGSPVALPKFEEGWFQVQDEAAQVVSHCLAPKAGERILDACAGLGGKTSHIAQLMGDRGRIEATDTSVTRLSLLSENVGRLGMKSISIIPYKDFLGRLRGLRGAYDRILVDAPCSGLGVIRRHPDIKWNREAASVESLSAEQKSLLVVLAPLLRAGGTMVYAVCTQEPEETREVVEGFLAGHPGWTPVNARAVLPASAGSLVDEDGFLTTAPEDAGPDGFFAAVLKSPS
jgi:16S rRNA (cytosine967-C5)-methyltransferase